MRPALRRTLGAARVRAFAQLRDLLPIAGRLPPLAAVRLLLASVPDDAEDAPLLLTATVAVAWRAVLRLRDGKLPVAPDPAAGHAADFLRMLKGEAPPAGRSRCARHLSGERGRSWAECFDVHRAGRGFDAGQPDRCGHRGAVRAEGPAAWRRTGAGARHAGCDRAGGECRGWLDAAVMRGDRLMGFGHRVYRVQDPRSDVVKAVVARLNRDIGRLRYAEAVEHAALAVLAKRKPNRSLQTNLEFYTALLLEALGMPRDAFTGAFAVARVVGWIAHALEQQAGGRLIRPQSEYIGTRRDIARSAGRAATGYRRRHCSPNAYSAEMSLPV